jgi:hypothetical protein
LSFQTLVPVHSLVSFHLTNTVYQPVPSQLGRDVSLEEQSGPIDTQATGMSNEHSLPNGAIPERIEGTALVSQDLTIVVSRSPTLTESQRLAEVNAEKDELQRRVAEVCAERDELRAKTGERHRQIAKLYTYVDNANAEWQAYKRACTCTTGRQQDPNDPVTNVDSYTQTVQPRFRTELPQEHTSSTQTAVLSSNQSPLCEAQPNQITNTLPSPHNSTGPQFPSAPGNESAASSRLRQPLTIRGNK